MKATIALIISVLALAVALSGVGRSDATPPGWLDSCVSSSVNMQKVGMTIHGRIVWVWTAAPDAPATLRRPGTIAVAILQPRCLGVHRAKFDQTPTPVSS